MVGGSRNAVAVFSRESGYDFRWSDLYCENLLFGLQPPIPRWRFWAKHESKPRVSLASLTMQDRDFIVKNGVRK